ncbi:MipA/OmpV family protein [Sphingomonas piscis]|uniref:MipA/OmpV family protein n=1 Tax=Sphingomonas piscis TaxID=2714943 RepID=A0A6G7YQD5_9SPHN|nr:MipA/OmpV family protein [Sphingomonas piscis]QIK78951.1 MipA/OmpV family protein [Sphingomonas piscis]
MKATILASAALLATASVAQAQDNRDNRDIRVRVGAGAQVRPEFIGADDREIAPYWDVDIARGDNPFAFEGPDDSFGVRLLSGENFSVGPAANIEGKRKEKDVGAPVGTVKTTIEVGGFADYLPSENFRLHAEALKGVNGHEGFVGSVGADYIARDGDKYVFSVGPRLLFSDSRYQRAYFGVTPAAAFASGLPAYRPKRGVHGVALASGLSYQFSPKFGLFSFARYERLVGDAAKSPIVREIGSRNQLSAGLGLNYTFKIAR